MRPLVLGHRGASGYAPENTIMAFQMALDQGADGIELDVQMSKDGEIVVIHDETVDRTSDHTGWVKDYTLAELKSFNYNYQNRTNPWNPGEQELGDVIFPEYEKAEIPTMREVFELFAPTDKIINIEIKTGIVFYPIEEKLVTLTHEFGMEDRVIYSSFNHASVMKVKEIDPNAKIGFLYADGPVDVVEYAKKNGADALHPAIYNCQYPNFMQDAAKAGLPVNVWTVNSKEHMGLCCKFGVNAMITNYPDVALQVAESLQ